MLVFMGDTVIMVTCRSIMLEKLVVLQNYCLEYGMKVNQSKTKFFVVCGGAGDSEALVAGELRVEYCDSYVYLGSTFTCDGSCLPLSRPTPAPRYLMYSSLSLVNKNNDVPFFVKK